MTTITVNDDIVFVVASTEKGKRSPVIWGVRSTYDGADELREEVLKEHIEIDIAEIVLAICKVD
jgi:hypothetical protein